MLPAFLERIISEKESEQPIDECRVSMPANSDFIQVTHYQQVSGQLGALVEESKKNLLDEIKSHLPACVNIQTLPVKQGKKSVMCVCLTLQMDAKHNRIDEINKLCDMAEVANMTVLHKMEAGLKLDNIHADMKPFYE